MKKFNLIPLLALMLALLLTLSACGGQEAEENVVPAESDIVATDAPATEPPATEPPATEPPAKDASLGRFEGSTYINDYVGISITFDENWTFADAEQLQQLPENIADLLEGTEVGDNMDALTQIMDMQAENVNDLTSINVLYQNLDLQTRLVYMAMTEEQILDAMLGESEMMIDSYKQMGLEVKSLEKVTATFLGEEHVALKTVCLMGDIEYHTLQFFNYHIGKYGVVTTFASFYEDATADLAAMCQAVE